MKSAFRPLTLANEQRRYWRKLADLAPGAERVRRPVKICKSCATNAHRVAQDRLEYGFDLAGRARRILSSCQSLNGFIVDANRGKKVFNLFYCCGILCVPRMRKILDVREMQIEAINQNALERICSLCGKHFFRISPPAKCAPSMINSIATKISPIASYGFNASNSAACRPPLEC